MNTQFSSGKLRFEFSTAPSSSQGQRNPEAPFGLAILGDFSGRGARGVREGIAGRRVWPIDCDNFESTLSRIEPRLEVALPASGAGSALPGTEGSPLEIRFQGLDDFHPDQLLRRVRPLAFLADLRKRLLNPATSGSAAGELGKLLASQPLPAPAMPAESPGPAATPQRGGAQKSAESDADTLSRLLGSQPKPAPPRPASPSAGMVERLIQTAVAPNIVAAPTATQTALLSNLELELAAQLRSVLHHPGFQALEAAWRGADLLVRTFGGEENLKLFLVDISKEEVAADLETAATAESSGLVKMLARQAADQTWTAWLGLYSFGDSPADLELLARLAKSAAWAGLPFCGGAEPRLAGCDSFGSYPDPDDWRTQLPAGSREAWQALCAMPEARAAALALPRFLLRQPYGQKSEPIEAFRFEEMPGAPVHEEYLWGNPAIACGFLLASAFLAEGPTFTTGYQTELSDLPLHRFEEQGEAQVKPCAEAWLTERAAQNLRGRRLNPLLSVRGRNAVRIEGLQSLAGTAFAFGR